MRRPKLQTEKARNRRNLSRMKLSPKQREALNLVADGKFIPRLVKEDDGWHARWRGLGIEDEGKSPAWTVAFTVSKGTYIRALARDIGRAAGGAAHIEALSRTASGSVGARDCLPLEGLDPARAREGALDPVRALGIPALAVGEDAAADVTCGRSLSAPAGAGPGRVALVRSGGLIAIARPEGTRLAPEIVFPQPIEGVRL